VTGRAKAINPALNLGDRFTLGDYIQTIDQLRNKLDAHNSALAAINSSQTEITALEKTLNEMTERMLIGVVFKFGKDSREYEMADGVRKSNQNYNTEVTHDRFF
jgi:HAMP domain-containing protein